MKATRDAYGEALIYWGKKIPGLVVLDADLSKSTKTAAFAKEYPHRFFNMGISEADMMGTAAGLAAAGKLPVASTFAVFAAGRAYDQIRNSIAYPRLNVKIAATHAGLTVGEDGASHQMLEDIALMRVLPNMTVLVPADAHETEGCLQAALEHKGPVYLRLGRPKVPAVYTSNENFQIGKGRVLREGNDAVVFCCGYMVGKAMEAAESLASQGIIVTVADMASIKPLDEELVVKLARQTGFVVTAEEHSIIGGLGSAVAEVLAEKMPIPLRRIGVKDTFGESGKPDEVMKKYGLTTQAIIDAVKSRQN